MSSTSSLSTGHINSRQERSNQRLAYTYQAIQNKSWRPDDVLIVGHRGCIGRFPENALAAIAACSKEAAHMAEIDVAVTANRHLVLLHDDTIYRPTNHQQWRRATNVSSLTLDS